MAVQTVRVMRIDVLGAALLSTVASAIAGLFIGILFLLSSLFMGSLLADIPLIGRAIAEMWTSMGVVGLIASPIVFAILGFVVGAVAAVCVNAVTAEDGRARAGGGSRRDRPSAGRPGDLGRSIAAGLPRQSIAVPAGARGPTG